MQCVQVYYVLIHLCFEIFYLFIYLFIIPDLYSALFNLFKSALHIYITVTNTISKIGNIIEVKDNIVKL
jgi:hypothetical protein